MVREYCEIRQEIINIQSTLIACQKMRSFFFGNLSVVLPLLKLILADMVDTGLLLTVECCMC